MSAPSPARDFRIDFFRGVALWFIFVNHVPNNAMAWLTNRNVGFSDATEIFVFLSGYSAALAYGRTFDRRGFGFATLQVWRRAWQLYVAHIVLFMFYAAQAAYVAERFSNPMYVEEMNLSHLLDAPHRTLLEAMLLRFRPANMDVLPLYIVLLLAMPAALLMLGRWHWALAAGSLGLWAGAHRLGWTLPTWPDGGGWFFNPFGWQLLFVYGMLCAALPARYIPSARANRALDVAAAAYLAFSLYVVLSWRLPALEATIPRALAEAMYPIDKSNLDVLRLLHFLAAAHLVTRLVPRDAAWLGSPVARVAIVCGQESLYVFCLGIYLSFAMTFVMVEFDNSLAMQVGGSALGIAAMAALAYALRWYRQEEHGRAPREPGVAPARD